MCPQAVGILLNIISAIIYKCYLERERDKSFIGNKIVPEEKGTASEREAHGQR